MSGGHLQPPVQTLLASLIYSSPMFVLSHKFKLQFIPCIFQPPSFDGGFVIHLIQPEEQEICGITVCEIGILRFFVAAIFQRSHCTIVSHRHLKCKFHIVEAFQITLCILPPIAPGITGAVVGFYFLFKVNALMCIQRVIFTFLHDCFRIIM